MSLEKFDNTILIVGNLGELKAYKVKYEMDISRQDDFKTSHKHHKGKLVEHLKFDYLQDEEFIEAHKKISELVTDKVGHFEGPFGGESGEEHNLPLEIEDRIIKLIAEHTEKTLRSNEHKKWYFAFPKEFNGRVINLIDDTLKSKLEKNIPENLVKLKPQEIVDKYLK
jgi:hypothetical protein